MITRILITGANGFLGSSIVKLAIKKKFDIKIFNKISHIKKYMGDSKENGLGEIFLVN